MTTKQLLHLFMYTRRSGATVFMTGFYTQIYYIILYYITNYTLKIYCIFGHNCTNWRIRTKAKMNNQCLIDIICLIEEAYHGITDCINVISVSVWQEDVINMQQLVRGRTFEANLLAKRAWYQFNFLMRWSPCHGLILFGVP